MRPLYDRDLTYAGLKCDCFYVARKLKILEKLASSHALKQRRCFTVASLACQRSRLPRFSSKKTFRAAARECSSFGLQGLQTAALLSTTCEQGNC